MLRFWIIKSLPWSSLAGWTHNLLLSIFLPVFLCKVKLFLIYYFCAKSKLYVKRMKTMRANSWKQHISIFYVFRRKVYWKLIDYRNWKGKRNFVVVLIQQKIKVKKEYCLKKLPNCSSSARPVLFWIDGLLDAKQIKPRAQVNCIVLHNFLYTFLLLSIFFS